MVRALIVLLLTLAFGQTACAQAQPNRFEGWTTAVIAGDWRAGRQPIMAFDNARRDVTRGFLAAGLPRSGMVDYSLRPDVPNPTTPMAAVEGVAQIAARNTQGCLLYFTSHGAPDGIVFGPDILVTPLQMSQLVRQWCGARPTVIVLSACFSGTFMGALQANNRMILTAARRDRTSFGCGADETYPWFDGCVIESLPASTDFLDLAAKARACVTRKETEAKVDLPSEPQLFVGSEMQLRLPTLRFTHPPG